MDAGQGQLDNWNTTSTTLHYETPTFSPCSLFLFCEHRFRASFGFGMSWAGMGLLPLGERAMRLKWSGLEGKDQTGLRDFDYGYDFYDGF